MQQMSISFGVAAAGLATALFVPSTHSNAAEMIHGIHKALIALGILTICIDGCLSQLEERRRRRCELA
jgi:hypothetical protein